MQLILPIVLIVLMGGMMWWQSKKAKQQQAEVQNFRENLAPGTEVVTIGGVIGKVVSVDTKYEEIVIDSEGSLLRFKASAVNKTYTRPAFVDDDDRKIEAHARLLDAHAGAGGINKKLWADPRGYAWSARCSKL